MRYRFSFNQNRPLSMEQICLLAPAALSEIPSSKVSDKYTFLSTKNVIEYLDKKDIVPFAAEQTHSKDRDTSKHMIRFRSRGALNAKECKDLGMLIPEIILTTSHDAKSAFRFNLGFFRFVCSNGLIVSDSSVNTISIKHMNANESEVIDAVFEVLDSSDNMIDQAYEMNKFKMTNDLNTQFAEEAFKLKFKNSDECESPKFDPRLLLQARRRQDCEPTLFNTMNIVQENLIRGGVRYRELNKDKTMVRRHITKAIRSIDENLRINKKIWELSELFLKNA